MKKEFIEFQSENGRAPYSASTICFCLTEYAKKYINEKRLLTKNIDINIRDAVLVDVINYMGMVGCIDFALYTKDLYDGKKHNDYVEPQTLITLLVNHLGNYIFKHNLVNSITRNKHMNNVKDIFDINDGILIIIDFINYITEVNKYDRVFTIKDLYEKYKNQHYNLKMQELKEFLESTNEYNEKLLNNESINSIFEQMAKENALKYVDNNGTYHYTDDISIERGNSKMDFIDTRFVDKEIYAMAYAFAKMKNNEQSQIPIIDKKILEMKKK